MNFNAQHSAPREHRYPFLIAFDLALNFLLCCGVFTFACALRGLILSNNASSLIARLAQAGIHFFN